MSKTQLELERTWLLDAETRAKLATIEDRDLREKLTHLAIRAVEIGPGAAVDEANDAIKRDRKRRRHAKPKRISESPANYRCT
jgi:hypothetical protein